MIDFDEFRANLEKLASEEIERRLAAGNYDEDSRLRAIASQIIATRKDKRELESTGRRDRFARRAVIAAWISAICAILSASATVINVIVSHNKKP